MTHITVVDEVEPIFARGLSESLRTLGHAVEQPRTAAPEVAIVGIHDDDLEPARLALGNSESVIAVCTQPVEPTLREACRLGIASVMSREAPPADYDLAVRAAAAGYSIVQGTLMRPLVDRLECPPRPLTRQECEILKGITQGSVETLAETLCYSARHMQRLLTALLRDLGIESHRDAILAAAKWGITTGAQPPDE